MWYRTTCSVLFVVLATGTISCMPGSGDGADAGGTDTGPPTTCSAVPTCDTGDEAVTECPDGGNCYTRTECGTTLTCLPGAGDAGGGGDTGQSDAGDAGAIKDACGAAPLCDPGDKQVDNCPDGGSCYTNEVCQTTITCLRRGDAGADGG